jgi:hypothetical protein
MAGRLSSWQRVTTEDSSRKLTRSSRAKLRTSRIFRAEALASRIPATRIRRFRRRSKAGESRFALPRVWATFTRTNRSPVVNRGRQASKRLRSSSGAAISASRMRATREAGLMPTSPLKWDSVSASSSAEAYCSSCLARITVSSSSRSFRPLSEMCCFLLLAKTASRLAEVVNTNSLTSRGEWVRISARILVMKLPVWVSASWSTYGRRSRRRKRRPGLGMFPL